MSNHKSHLILGLKLFVICFVVGLCVSLVHSVTSAKLERAKSAGNIEILLKVLPGDYEFLAVPSEVFASLKDKSIKAYEAVKDEKVQGYCVEVTAKGYQVAIHLMVGISESGAINAVEVLSSNETPGIGANVLEQDYLNTFKGAAYPIEFSDSTGALKPISGATVTSKAIRDALNEALQAVSLVKGSEGTK